MILSDFHIHTTFSDGKNTPEEMVQKAIELGLKKIGISDHSYTDFDESCCIKKENKEAYIAEINRLKEKYQSKIEIYLGIEQDIFSSERDDMYDYVIGSVHYVKVNGVYIDVDKSKDAFKLDTEKYFSGDYLSFAEEYFKTVAKVAEIIKPDILGHFDLITKFNENSLFSQSDERYVAAWQNAADILLEYNIPFEINTGVIARGHKTKPYPAPDIINYIKERGGSFILSSDSHSADTICYRFDKYEGLLK